MLDALCRRFGGGPVGLSTLAVAVGEEPETVETVAEPFLVREGLLARTPRGRVALPAAWEHLGLTPPVQAVAVQGAGDRGRRRRRTAVARVRRGGTARLDSRGGCGTAAPESAVGGAAGTTGRTDVDPSLLLVAGLDLSSCCS